MVVIVSVPRPCYINIVMVRLRHQANEKVLKASHLSIVALCFKARFTLQCVYVIMSRTIGYLPRVINRNRDVQGGKLSQDEKEFTNVIFALNFTHAHISMPLVHF